MKRIIAAICVLGFVACLVWLWRLSDAHASVVVPADSDLLFRVVCAECLSCSASERVAIAHVAVNRAKRPSWWGKGLRSVLLKPGQFAAPDNPYCERELPPPPTRADGVVGWSPVIVDRHQRLVDETKAQVVQVLGGVSEDPTGGATFFHAKRLGKLWPHLNEVDVPKVWLHRFYRD